MPITDALDNLSVSSSWVSQVSRQCVWALKDYLLWFDNNRINSTGLAFSLIDCSTIRWCHIPCLKMQASKSSNVHHWISRSNFIKQCQVYVLLKNPNPYPRNSFLRFRAGLKVNLRQYIKSDFDLFWGPDVLWRSDFDVINRSPNFIRLLLNSPLESHWIRGLKLTSKLRAVQFWVSWKKMTTKSERRTSVSSSTVW